MIQIGIWFLINIIMYVLLAEERLLILVFSKIIKYHVLEEAEMKFQIGSHYVMNVTTSKVLPVEIAN